MRSSGRGKHEGGARHREEFSLGPNAQTRDTHFYRRLGGSMGGCLRCGWLLAELGLGVPGSAEP
jgi:hypothetical protein